MLAYLLKLIFKVNLFPELSLVLWKIPLGTDFSIGQLDLVFQFHIKKKKVFSFTYILFCIFNQ